MVLTRLDSQVTAPQALRVRKGAADCVSFVEPRS
jgi:hypothetical protein